MWREAIQQVLITEAELHRRIRALGKAITTDYQGKDLTLVAVIRGAMMFSADLARAVDLPLTLDCIALSKSNHTTLVHLARPRPAVMLSRRRSISPENETLRSAQGDTASVPIFCGLI